MPSAPPSQVFIPPRWAERYVPFATDGWHGWLDRALRTDGAAVWFGRPERSLDYGVVRWFKQGRNRLAEVRWPDNTMGTRQPDVPETVVVKEFGARDLWGRLRAKLRPSRALNGWQRAFEIIERGFITPRPLWIALPVARPVAGQAYLAVETAPPHTRLREILKQVRAGQNEICLDVSGVARTYCDTKVFLRAMGRWTRNLHDAGIWHRDFSGGNILVPQGWSPNADENALPPFILLDVNRSRMLAPGRMTLRMRLQDLERVSLDEAGREIFYGAYCEGSIELESAADAYRRAAENYRILRETSHPVARFWRKVFTYWLRIG